MSIPSLITFVAALFTFGLALAFRIKGRRLRAEAERRFLQAENSMLAADGLERKAKEDGEIAEHLLKVAAARQNEARRIEDLLTHPRFALQTETGRVRALRADEKPDVTSEIECGAPYERCKKCYGSGWTGRDRRTGQIIPCPCVKRAI